MLHIHVTDLKNLIKYFHKLLKVSDFSDSIYKIDYQKTIKSLDGVGNTIINFREGNGQA